MDETIEQRFLTIEKRNLRVESEKAWETSWARFWCNTCATYLTMNLLLWTIGGPFPPVHALIPTVGYVLSTLSIPHVKRWWMSKNTPD